MRPVPLEARGQNPQNGRIGHRFPQGVQFVNKLKLAGVILLGCAAASCQQASTPEAASTAPAAPAATATKLQPQAIGVTLEALGPGGQNPNGTYTIPVRIRNTGKVVLSGAGNPPVNVGVRIEALNGAGAVTDFSRTPLPAIAPGQAKDVAVLIPVDPRLSGHTLVIELVEEHVAWFSALGHPGIQVGPYSVCGKSLCVAAH